MQLKMEPQSAEVIPAKSEDAVTQNITINNPNKVSCSLCVRGSENLKNNVGAPAVEIQSNIPAVWRRYGTIWRLPCLMGYVNNKAVYV